MITEEIKYILFIKTINTIRQLYYNLINAFEYILCDFDLVEYLETSFVREVAIATAIGSLTFCAMLIIFVAQITSNNEEEKYNSHSAAIYDFCNLRSIIVINSLLIVNSVIVSMSLQFHEAIHILLLTCLYLLILINILCYLHIFYKSRQIIVNDYKWLAFYQTYHWGVIDNLIKYHGSIVKQTAENNKKIQEQIDNYKKENQHITYLKSKIPYRKDEIFTLNCEQVGILKFVDIKKINNIIGSIHEADIIFVDVYINLDDGVETGTKLVMFRTNINLRDEERRKIEQEILSKKSELHNCFEIYPIQTKNAINSFKYLYANKLIVNYSDTYIFNFLLCNALYEMHIHAVESARYSAGAYKNFLNVYFYNLILVSESNSRYAFCRNCDFLIDLFYGSGDDLREWSEDEYVENLIKIFNNSKHKYDFIHGFTLVLLYFVNNKIMSRSRLKILTKCWFHYSDYIVMDCEDLETANGDYIVLKFHFNSIVLHYLVNSKQIKDNAKNLNDEGNRVQEDTDYADYYIKNIIDVYFKNFNIFDYFNMLKEDSDLLRNFVIINDYGFDKDKARYDILVELLKYCKPKVHYDITDIRAHFEEIKTYRFQYMVKKLKKIDDDKYRQDLKEFIGDLIKSQVEAEYKQEYTKNFNNHFAENLLLKSNITPMYIYLKILQDNNCIIKTDNIDNRITVPYNKLIFKDLYSDDLWAISECSSIAYSICYDLDKELLKYFCDNAVELIDNIDLNDFVCISTFDADIKFEYRVENDELKIDNEYYKYLFIKKDNLPKLLWPINPKFDLNISGKLNDVAANKDIDRKLGLELNEENIGKMIIYNSPKLKYKGNAVIYKSRALHKK